MDDKTSKKSMPKWLSIVVFVGGVILVIAGLFKIFGASSSNTLVNKFNKLQAPAIETKDDLTSVSNLLTRIEAKETNKDYSGINADLQTALTKLNDAATKVESTSTTLTEFQSLIDSSSNQDIKTTGGQFIDMFKWRNATVLKMVADAKDLVNQAITYYTEVGSNKKVTIDVAKFTAAAKTFAENAASMATIGMQYDAAVNDFAKAAGFTVKEK